MQGMPYEKPKMKIQVNRAKIVFSTTGTGKLRHPHVKSDSGHSPYGLHTNDQRIDHRANCKMQNSKTPRRNKGEKSR